MASLALLSVVVNSLMAQSASLPLLVDGCPTVCLSTNCQFLIAAFFGSAGASPSHEFGEGLTFGSNCPLPLVQMPYCLFAL
ncbi:hypothetical protein Q2T83_06740 [Fervidibacter sacchari]|uniref:Uncharacterized protein n=1 Tax=Candidatus Fervidibacter sacchari TaxID=1448929 RepID=A0ABT2EMU4_9BACT|nr:hypothetical protein [Candidatus Fervidibacter sacchari]MCS3918737.1 hypothetical protein [Candidatus Fervidibacter sacchari]MCS3918746.1 hypothetical protein [Candidatus Fervidibacter sacchari]WKU17504.1 hypothetical protein Q2T83_06695 [Candidatus Fervidibacter sacchari]WKU17513.1 hypothetical protein Q2T83_06740 [Candidatus Fervidibacter sacchari]